MPFTDSESVTATLPIKGVWIHDPDAPDATIRNFAFGANQRADTFDPMGSGSFYAGRAEPVFDYGDPIGRMWDLVIDIPYGETHDEDLALLREFAAARKNVWIRDNRGRAMYGAIGSLKITDTPFGEQASFTVTAAYRTREVATS
jgi:hypothetical protein